MYSEEVYRLRSWLAGVLGLVLLVVSGPGCETPAPPEEAETAAPAEPIQEPAAGPETAPLKEIMAQLGQDVNAVSYGIWTEDYEAIAAGAEAIAQHPKVSEAERQAIAEVLGSDFRAFAEADRFVHDTALELEEAARQHDMGAVLNALDTLQQGCVACHTDFRSRLLER